MRLDAFDGVAHAGDFVGGQVIHDNDISGFEFGFGHQNLLDTGLVANATSSGIRALRRRSLSLAQASGK